MRTKLGVNIDHIATLRQARGTPYPDPVLAAKLAQDSGADMITCHLREDRRHIQDADLPALRGAVEIPINLEMAATEEMLGIALGFKPSKVTLVPERREELTTEGGLRVAGAEAHLQRFIDRLQDAGISVSLFIDADATQIQAGRKLGAKEIEIHTGTYCDAPADSQPAELEKIVRAAELGKSLGFYVAAGHGLNYRNIFPFKNISEIQEYNIGHSIVAHAVIVGWERAVREMRALLP